MTLSRNTLVVSLSMIAVVAIAITLLTVQPMPAQNATASRVSGRVFEIWVKSAFAPPGAPPFLDCARFTRTQMCLDACGDCGSLAEIPSSGTPGGLWEGHVPCGGLFLRFYGTSFDGFPGSELSKPALGATALGLAEQTMFGAGGVESPACTLDGGRPSRNPYAKRR